MPATPWTPQHLLDELNALGIAYQLHEHPPVYTVEAAREYWPGLPGLPVKNLLLKDAHRQMWLVVAPAEEPVDLKALRGQIGSNRLSFANAADLAATLAVEGGAVTPLAVVNDRERRIAVVLDVTLAGPALIKLHPLVNTATLSLAGADVVRFLTAHHHPPRVMALPR